MPSEFLSHTAWIDKLAAESPDDVWIKSPVTSDKGAVTWQDITFLELSKAVDTMARWMEKELGLGTGDEPVAYTGVNDARYPIIILAALKTGYKGFMVSPRNSLEGNLHLLKATQCSKFIHSAEFKTTVDGVAAEAAQLRTSQVPELQEILSTSSDAPYESRADRYLQDDKTVLILHSSGSTGNPKPVYLNGGIFRVGAQSPALPVPEGRKNVHNQILGTRLMLCTMPFFHVYGVMMISNRSFYNRGPLALLPPGVPPTAELLLDVIAKVNPSVVVCAPSILEDICNVPGGVEKLSKLEHIFYGGAPLAKACGDEISKVTTLVNTIGNTESFNFPNLIPLDGADWEYFEWNPNCGIVMEPTAEDGVAELVIQRQPGNDYQGVFHNFPGTDEFRPNDLFEQHPTKEGLWKYVGRADDIIVLRNGEKTNPVSFEKAIEGHHWVKGALVVGTGQLQTGLIIELHAEHAHLTLDEVLKDVWPVVEEAHKHCQAHAHVWRTMVLLSTPTKPFKRAPKGSIMRKATNKLYEDEIKILFEGPADTNSAAQGNNGLNNSQIRDMVKKAVLSVVEGHVSGDITDDANLFKLGADSLQVMQIRQVLSSAGVTCPTRAVYENPSINLLAKALGNGASSETPAITVSREEKMSAMIHKYTDFAPVTTQQPSDSSSAMLLVGSTGALGTHLLHELLQNPSITRIYCLNRSADAAARQTQAFLDRGLTLDTPAPDNNNLASHPKIRFLTGQTHLPLFGLDSTTYADLQADVATILLNAWPVNFNSTLATFEDNIAGVKRCVDFAAGAPRRPHIGFEGAALTVPEAFELDNSLPARQGYGESKHVASSILARAAREGVVGGTVLRVGQLAGTAEAEGVWNRHGDGVAEWVPSLIKTSKSLGKIPRSLGPSNDNVIWVPVDTAAKIILEFLPLDGEKEDSREAGCFNVMNPQITQWSALVATTQEYYAKEGHEIVTVDLDEWLDELKGIDAAQTPEQIDQYPAVKILDFFEGLKADGDMKGPLTGFATEKGSLKSPAMAGLRSLEGSLMQKWLQEWDF
ncbi:uncharacterized protein B0H64DRAFT_367005 [Chaetomium fimeti]|uniref:Carrier domain-containing protein n=1 Tax=Chaetomium fimeti TaxID=1854472 RepID=A0AAE0H802_9PEZI|nr:hypothetical protein B0H64DRAFT_367005 [Chaetomium fimeti]